MTVPEPGHPRRLPEWPIPQPPQPPATPPPTTRLPVIVERFGATLEERLLDRRIVAITGVLDAESVTEHAARLLHLDALSSAPVTVRLDSTGGDLGAALVLVDTFGAMRAPVHVVVVGQACGAAVAVFAAADQRAAYPHARIVLTEPELPALQGDASHLDAHVAEQRRLLEAAYDVIATACSRSRDEVAADMHARRMLTAEEAVGYGLVDRIEG